MRADCILGVPYPSSYVFFLFLLSWASLSRALAESICLLFYVLFFFGHKACGILASQLGIKLILPALEGEVLTTGPAGRSLGQCFLSCPSESTDTE